MSRLGYRIDALERRMLLSLAPAGAEFRVNSFTTDHQGSPTIGMDADGDFVVAWHSDQAYGYYEYDYDIQAQRYSPTGVPQGAEFPVNSFTTGHQRAPAIGMDADGDFVVAWHTGVSLGYGEIYAQRYN